VVSVTVRPEDRVVDLRPGEELAAGLIRAGIDLATPCGGQGVCGGCRVRIEPPHAAPPTPCDEIEPADVRRGWRQACRCFPSRDIEVWIPEVGKGERPPPEVQAVAVTEPVGLAVDLGSTTLEVALVGLESGRELGRASALNPQTRFGADVISRVALGSTSAGLRRLAHAVRGGVDGLLEGLARGCGVHVGGIRRAVVAGNATMLQLALEVDPSGLGRAPWELAERGGRVVGAARLGLALHPEARVYLPPVPHAFFGADAVAGLATMRGFFAGEGPRLFIDLGTNGELALGAGGRRWCCSVAAGPAFEGVGLSCGMRATEGAIDRADVIGGDLACSIIGRGDALGVCGSGLVDLLAGLREIGVIEPSGRMPREGYRIAEGVALTRQDVRLAQLAKAAVRVGIDVLLEEAGVEVEDVEELAVAGAFGGALRIHSLQAIGLIPPGLAERVVAVGNSSLAGAIRLLVEPPLRQSVERQTKGLVHVPLSRRPDFEERFLCQLAFPA
jgi:uncharacterized 2Fe-2S/4Fe-4S cluster protein (DUF4445 family)